MVDKIDYWLDIANYDLETAVSNFSSGKYLYTVFMCQQCIEKKLKAIYVKNIKKEPPFTHNLIHIANKLKIDFSDNQLEFLARLSSYYIEGRYPSYKIKLSELVDGKTAEDILNKTKDLFKWLDQV